MESRFQINLHGIIDLLSHHLYSTPSVYVRELLQNATDAIRARERVEPGFRGRIDIEIADGAGGGAAQIVFTDNGIGLTEEETHRFLATIGESSKREDVAGARGDFIGQFGIGLLSCFVVSEEIAMVSRSAKGGPAVSWRGKTDGTYRTERRAGGGGDGGGDGDPVGTVVHLRARADMGEWLGAERVRELAWHFGALLPYPIHLTTSAGTELINGDPPPWRRAHDGGAARRAAYMDFGRRMFDRELFDYIPLKSAEGNIEGVAYVLPESPSPTARPQHRVYLKNMLLSDRADNVLPPWAFFVTCVLDARELRPTASRESFYEDEVLDASRAALGRGLRDYLLELRREHPERLEALIAIHYQAIKALAAHDDEFLGLFVDWLPFETSFGRLTFAEVRARFGTIRYAPTVDAFRQIAQVASAQGLGVINAGYSYDTELLERLQGLQPQLEIVRVSADDLVAALAELDLDEREQAFDLVRIADLVLQPFRCRAEIKKFAPAELPVIFVASDDARFLRSIEQSREVASDHWNAVLGNLAGAARSAGYAQLCFNYNNPLVRRLARLDDRKPVQLGVQMLYVQSLLLGHHPLSSRELALMNTGLLDFIEWGLDQSSSSGGGGSSEPRGGKRGGRGGGTMLQ